MCIFETLIFLVVRYEQIRHRQQLNITFFFSFFSFILGVSKLCILQYQKCNSQLFNNIYLPFCFKIVFLIVCICMYNNQQQLQQYNTLQMQPYLHKKYISLISIITVYCTLYMNFCVNNYRILSQQIKNDTQTNIMMLFTSILGKHLQISGLCKATRPNKSTLDSQNKTCFKGTKNKGLRRILAHKELQITQEIPTTMLFFVCAQLYA
eukprot:TRINITY_DN4435_c3_g1_i1.p1 TRINITY_DN4435_c3_g1~~TRINITY_DN4435_c3_g1_i1.p1  ORF type:complete len:208 (+),score=-14.91 TRINITY_DN4435_c3_g1_i1:408-1031(+)